jgi:hypothetical protein
MPPPALPIKRAGTPLVSASKRSKPGSSESSDKPKKAPTGMRWGSTMSSEGVSAERLLVNWLADGTNYETWKNSGDAQRAVLTEKIKESLASKGITADLGGVSGVKQKVSWAERLSGRERASDLGLPVTDPTHAQRLAGGTYTVDGYWEWGSDYRRRVRFGRQEARASGVPRKAPEEIPILSRSPTCPRQPTRQQSISYSRLLSKRQPIPRTADGIPARTAHHR